MRSLVAGGVTGTVLLQMQAELLHIAIFATLLCSAIAIVVGFALANRSLHSIARSGMHMVCGLVAGFCWAGLFAHYKLQDELPREWEGKDVVVIGTIDSLPFEFERGVRFHFAVERVVHDGQATPPVPARLALSWYSAFHIDELQAVGKVQPGERWQLTVRLRRPHGNANPHGFDYEVWLLEQGLRATGYVRPDQRSAHKNIRLDRFVPTVGNIVERSRATLRKRIFDALPEKPFASVLVALVVGDQRALAHSDWEVFNRTGIGHLISISGLHITMIAGLVASLVLALWRRSFFTRASLPLLLPAQKAAAAAGVLAALVYVLLAGFGVPAQRTLYMLCVVAFALWTGRITAVSHVLGTALAIVVILDPWSVLWPGFWLSFGAVAVILYGSVGRAHEFLPATASWHVRFKGTLGSAIHVQYVVTIGLVPLTMLLFGQISLVSPIANAIAIPLVSFIVTPLALLGSIAPQPLNAWLLECAHWNIAWLAGLLSHMSEWPRAVWTAPVPPWWSFACAMAGMAWLLAPKGWPMRWLGILALLPVVLGRPERPEQGSIWVTAFDVGQGMGLLVETPRRRLLYDTGPSYSPEADGGNRVILPYLKARGISSLDAMVVSHSDADHSGGALSILKEMPVGWVASSLPEQHGIVQRANKHHRCQAGQEWTWDGVRFEMLHPEADSYDNPAWKPNARSCTLKITVGGRAILLAGDIEARQEASLVERKPDALRADVLLAPHHGSGTSSTLGFLRAVSPELALFQVGYRNRYRHPKGEVYERYGELGITRLRSDDSGAIHLRIGKDIDTVVYRRDHARYWYGR